MLHERKQAPTQSEIMGEVDGYVIRNTSYAPVPQIDLVYSDDDYSKERERSMNHNSQYGVMPMTKEEQEAEKELNWGLVKQFTMNVFSFDFAHFSFPVAYSEPRSFLERTADIFTFLADKYIDLADEEASRAKRLIYLATGILSGFQLYMQSKKPWNPVLGETYTGGWANGNKIFAEQISHHPAISAFEIHGQKNKWKCSSQCQFSISAGPRKALIKQAGVFSLSLSDGTMYEWEFPDITVWGVIYGDRIIQIEGPVTIRDITNDLECIIELWPSKDRNKQIYSTQASTVWGSVFQSDDYYREPLYIISGDYTDKLIGNYDSSNVLWDIRKDIVKRPLAHAQESEILPSDSRYRLDRAMLIQNQIEEAETAKRVIEESQRREEKMRNKI